MKTPTRDPRPELFTILKNYKTAADHEVVTQDDGRRARFVFTNGRAAEGWRFRGWLDADDFLLMDYDEQTGETAKKLVDSERPLEGFTSAPLPAVGPDEDLHAYVWGGVMSMRGGLYVTPKGEPNRVLRHKMTVMS